MASSNSSDWSDDDGYDGREIDKTFELLKEGKEKLRLDPRYRNVTLVLGMSGTDKSTFVQWLAGDDTKLISEKVPGSGSSFVVKDDSEISTNSSAFIPNLVVHPETGHAFYDCPEFGDISTSPSVDIAGAHFIKSVAEFAANVRMIFLFEQVNVKHNLRGNLFGDLLEHSTDLLKNVDKFGGSIALVVTKVENTVVGLDLNGAPVYESDKNIIESIGNFLKDYRGYLKADSTKEHVEYVKFIDALLRRDDQNNYSNIAISRQPDMAGPLSEIPLMKKGKTKVLKLVKQLKMAPSEENNFGYSLSESNKNLVTYTCDWFKSLLHSRAHYIAVKMDEFIRQSVGKIFDKIYSFVSATESVVVDVEEAQTFSSKFTAVERELSVATNVTRKMLVDKLNYTVTAFGLDELRPMMERIIYEDNRLDFLENVIDFPPFAIPWESRLEDFVNSLSTTKQSIQTVVNSVVENLNQMVNLTVSEIAIEMWQAKLEQIQSQDIQMLPVQLDQNYLVMRNMTTELNKANTEKLANAISKTVLLLDVETDLIKSKTLSISTRAKYLTYLQALSDQPLNTGSLDWIASFGQTAQSILNASKWYQFLNGLYSKLGEYEFQQDTSRYNVGNLYDWDKGQAKEQNIHIDEQNENQFLNKLSQYNIPGVDTIKAIQLSQWQLDELNQLLSLTLKHNKAGIECTENENLFVNGDYVKLSDLKQKLVEECPSRINSVNIFASNTLFIDSDLNGVGDKLKLTLMAPKWEVVGERRINLDGSTGESPNPLKAISKVGKPGLPGESSGSFLGVAQRIANAKNLTITANGGVGGAGQKGGDGAPGLNGEHAPVPDAHCSGFQNTKFKNKFLYQGEVERDFATGKYYQVKIYGTAETGGEEGCDGGAGGIGGKRGQIQVYNLDRSTRAKVPTNQGNDGEDGRGGLGGLTGLHGNDIIASCEHWTSIVLDKWKMTGFDTKKFKESKRAKNGLFGTNRQGIRDPEDASFIVNPANVINEFKTYLKSNLNGVNDRFKQNTIITVLEQIDAQSYTLARNLEDFGEKSLVTLRKINNSIYSSEPFLNLIANFADLPKSTQKFDQYTKMLSYLSPATLDMLYSLKSASAEPNKIYAMDGLLDYVKEVKNTLNELLEQHLSQHMDQMANIIAKINHHSTDELDRTNATQTAEPQLLLVAKVLETLIQSKFVLKQYDAVVLALKQLVFPYAKIYMDDYSLVGLDRNSTDIGYLVDSAVASLDTMRLRLIKDQITTTKFDEYIFTGVFDSSYCRSNPFYVWSTIRHANTLAKLLSGESVTFKADIRNSDPQMDAIKFERNVRFNFKVKNPTFQAELDTKLEKFKITANHTGNSYYRYGGKYYVINHEPLNILYSFAKRSDRSPIESSEAFDSIQKGTSCLSPYTMWNIQLTKMNETVSFDQLKMYNDKVDLELVGRGSYITSEVTHNEDDLQLAKYYTEYVHDETDLAEQYENREDQCRDYLALKRASNSIHRSDHRLPTNSTLSYMSRLGQTLTNYFGGNSSATTPSTNITTHPRFEYTKHNTDNNSNLTQPSNSVDVHGNLLMGQLLVGLISGKNNTITSSESYQTPEQTRNLELDRLAQRVVPGLSESSATRFRSNQIHNSNNQWHRDWNDTSREHN